MGEMSQFYKQKSTGESKKVLNVGLAI